jgi:hypothetical protein
MCPSTLPTQVLRAWCLILLLRAPLGAQPRVCFLFPGCSSNRALCPLLLPLPEAGVPRLEPDFCSKARQETSPGWLQQVGRLFEPGQRGGTTADGSSRGFPFTADTEVSFRHVTSKGSEGSKTGESSPRARLTEQTSGGSPGGSGTPRQKPRPDACQEHLPSVVVCRSESGHMGKTKPHRRRRCLVFGNHRLPQA